MQKFAIKTLENDVYDLKEEANGPLRPCELDVVYHEFTDKKCQRYAVIVIFHVDEKIKIYLVSQLRSGYMWNISHKNIKIEPKS